MIMLSLFFKPESELFNSATKEYKDIWKSEGEKIINIEDKKGTLIHELGHRLIAPLHNRQER